LSVIRRHNTKQAGSGPRAMVFAHGFGCDQNMWRFVAPAFEGAYRTILFDHVGAGGSDLSAYDPEKYATLDGYADDVVELSRALDVTGGVFVGHSVSAMIGVLALKKAPELFDTLVMVCPSPRYIDDGDYEGGFSLTGLPSAQIDTRNYNINFSLALGSDYKLSASLRMMCST
jgi:sigma-B regulation protein RsbQ